MSDINKILDKNKQILFLPDIEKKVLTEGCNIFHTVGDIEYFFIHIFVDMKGYVRKSICTQRDDNKKYCRICKKYNSSIDILNNENEEDDIKIKNAEVVIGDRPVSGKYVAFSWEATEMALFNVVDKDDVWCRENNHTKILSEFIDPENLGIFVDEKSVFNEIVNIVQKYGDPDNYDIELKKMSNSYEINIANSELTLSEKEYKTYNLKKLARPTTDKMLKQLMG